MAQARRLDEDSILDNPNRKKIRNVIETYPGIHLRGICAETGLPLGTVMYHARTLESRALIYSHEDGSFKRFFIPGTYSSSDKNLIAALRRRSLKLSLQCVSEYPGCTQEHVMDETSLSRSVVSYSLRHLANLKLLTVDTSDEYKKYSTRVDASSFKDLGVESDGVRGYFIEHFGSTARQAARDLDMLHSHLISHIERMLNDGSLKQVPLLPTDHPYPRYVARSTSYQ